ncbi:Radical_SAM C-terminal domain-containing protein [Desulfocicer vacuolatum DSM 3385]|uniref:Radical_SAM C-terminal domain-containing protein n=1 Tax=Desulfocicer vacuolatum DSM 3385 TaxID=1121400 RepID=A0A1W2E4F2_9BACT|nr:radical SAM protein [Desulfocicer vacuolatum]SMD04649.1 Radical_SAM C-terminal domain-containing protein [Desulfocicer vacuolatum DSM 3385]
MRSEKPLVIPIFIPHSGCPHQCAFCNQSIITSQSHPLPDADFIEKEVNRFLEFKGKRRQVQLAFFGGNFLGLPQEKIVDLLECAKQLVNEGKIDDVRCSTRPDTISESILGAIKNYDLTTVELGVQSMDNRVLAQARRGHTREDTKNAAGILKAYGIHTGMQMMVGLPGDTFRTALETAEAICRLKPDFMRIYPLIVLEGSVMTRWYRQGRYIPMELSESVTLVKELYKIFNQHKIPVIRMGLQASDLLQDPQSMVAGPWHPAFGHLVFSELFLDRTLDEIEKKYPMTVPEQLILTVHPASHSRLRGDKNHNMKILQSKYPRSNFTVKTDSRLGRETIIIS